MEEEHPTYWHIDPILLPWAKQRGLTVDKVYRDDEVRSIRVPGVPNRNPIGQEAQLWIDWPEKDGSVIVGVAVGRWGHKVRATVANLRTVLDEQYELLQSQARNQDTIRPN